VSPCEHGTTAGWTRFYAALRNIEDEHEVITFGLFDGHSTSHTQQQGSGATAAATDQPPFDAPVMSPANPHAGIRNQTV
jgi:hypothetical protein